MNSTEPLFIPELPLFPLSSMLMPDGVLQLKIFEQRYLTLTKECLRDNKPFGVCLIHEGAEVGLPATTHETGCLGYISDWEMPHTGIFHLRVKGGARFRLLHKTIDASGLQRGHVECWAEPQRGENDTLLQSLLQKIIKTLGQDFLIQPLKYEDPVWVAYRLAELLPFPNEFRQQILQAHHSDAMSEIIRDYLKSSKY
jgi:Lon protease-like protein